MSEEPAALVQGEMDEAYRVSLLKIEFDPDFEPVSGAPHRTYFYFRLHIAEGYQQFVVTMTEPYDDLEDLRQKAWIQFYTDLRLLTEAARRIAHCPEMTFKDAPPVGKYGPLRAHLNTAKSDVVTMTFSELDKIIDLPRSARTYREWWANEDPEETTHVQCRSWQAAGFNAEADLKAERVTFRRKRS